MKVLLLSSYDNQGGAARAAYRLHQGLNAIGVDSRMSVQTKTTADPKVRGPKTKVQKGAALLRPCLDDFLVKLCSKRNKPLFSPGVMPRNLDPIVSAEKPDIVHLHWVGSGFMRPESLRRICTPIVWTLHDMWAFTGGCHYVGDCNRYQDACGACPILGSQDEHDLSRWILRRKRKTIAGLNLTLITPSRWLAECAASSFLFRNTRVEVVPNGLDLARYHPIPSRTCRELLSLPQGKRLIGFGGVRSTTDARKGFGLLVQSIRRIIGTPLAQDIELVVFGASNPENPLNLGLQANYMGHLNDDITLALLYGACDVFVAPSTMDNLPNTVMEAMACATPCVAFRVGGMPDLIDHLSTGYLADPLDIDDLTRGILSILSNADHLRNLSIQARQKVEKEYSLEIIAARHKDLYQQALARQHDPH